ncbi:MAG: SH3 domain-containing protein [Bacteroidota bacterium]
MKQCPRCGVTYADSLQFCTVDGTPLAPLADPVMPAGPLVSAPAKGIGTVVWVGLGLAALAIAVAVGVWIGSLSGDGPRQGGATPFGKPGVTADDTETDDVTPDDGAPEDATENDVLRVLVVDSPRDGFLAIRSEPSARTGQRIGQALHGERIRVLSDTGPRQTIGGRSGQWLYVRYRDIEGWAFDAFTIPLRE